MRRFDLVFASLLLPLDFLALVGAAVTAYALRYSRFFTEIRPILTDISFDRWLAVSLFFALVWMALFALAGLYSMQRRRAWNTLGRIILACTAGAMIVIATVFFRLEWQTSRFLVLAVWGFAILYVGFFRLSLHVARKQLLRAHIGHQRMAIVGHSETSNNLERLYRAAPWIGITIEKHLKTWNDAARKDVQALCRKRKLDIILLADPELDRETALDLIAFAEEHHVEFRYLADLFSATFTKVEMDTTGGIPVIQVKRTPLDGWGRIFKRLADLVVSGVLLIILSPFLLLTAIIIKLDSRGPIFYKLDNDASPKRVGERGIPFRYFKFRSMFPHTHMMRYKQLKHLDTRSGPLIKIKDDPRITRIGSFLRRWSIDELPELFSVFMGKMSLVGPRPHLPEEVSAYKPHHRRVLAIKPGITGMAQVSGRSDLDFEDEVRLDAWYIENWSPFLDLYILLKTPWAVLKKRKTD